MRRILQSIITVSILTGLSHAASDIEQSIEKLKKRETRSEAVKAIETKGKSAAGKLRQLIHDEKADRESRVSAIVLLGRIKSDEDRGELEGILGKDRDKFGREAAAIALGHMGDEQAIPQLKKALEDESANVRLRAAWALGKMGDKSGEETALKALRDTDVSAQLLAVDAIEVIGDKSIIPELKSNLKSQNTWTRIHSNLAIKKLVMLGLSEAEKLNYLREALKDEQFETNQWAAGELGKFEVQEAKDFLKAAAKDNSHPGNYAARKILFKLGKEGKLKSEDLDK